MRITKGFAALLAASTLAARAPKEALPAPEIRLRIIAPSPTGPWTLRIENEELRTLRIAADIRLLRFEIDPGEKSSKPVRCELPRPLRPDRFPEDRALYLAPGRAYVESFDPRLFCFGKKEAGALRGGAVVRTHYGWGSDPANMGRGSAFAVPSVVEGLSHPPEVEPLRELKAPTLVLSHAEPEAVAEPSPTRPPPEEPAEFDENAPRLALTAEPFSEARDRLHASATLTATNVGHRSMKRWLHRRMFGFRVAGRGTVARCDPAPEKHATPPDLLRTLAPGASVTLSVLLEEVCPDYALERPGLYRITSSLPDAEGRPVTLLRLLSAPKPFYARPPEANVE